MDPVVHFEMPAEDKDRVVEFYSRVFGWKAQKLGPEMGNYVVVCTSETGADGRPKNPGTINGGIFEKSGDNKYPSVVIAVKDIRKAMKDVKEAGGNVIPGYKDPDEPDEIPGIGLYAAFIDTEGNRVGMLQPKSGM